MTETLKTVSPVDGHIYVERALDTGAQWASYDNGIGAVAYFGADGAEPERSRLAA